MVSLLIGLMSLIAAVDIKTFRIPDSLVATVAASGLLLYGVAHIYSAGFLGGISLIAHYAPRQPTLGKGDIKLMIALGLFIPFWFLDIFCILTGISGILYAQCRPGMRGTSGFPFAPALTFAFVIVILLAEQGISGL